jgi:hypothetical protein
MIKTYFFYGILAIIGFSILGLFLFHLGKGLWGMFGDWRLHRELDELQADGNSRRQAREAANQLRLDNGCDHDFDGALGGFPAGVCHKCGLEKEKPTGTCDHVWRPVDGPIPSSVCEKCGRSHSAATERGSLA